jgi:hypothetical protein
MSKFSEMRAAVDDGRRKWSEYQQACYQDIAEFVSGFVNYCQIPEENFALVPVNKEPNLSIKYLIAGAAHYEADGYWHFGVVIKFFPLRSDLLEFGLTRTEGKVSVIVGREGKGRDLNLSKPNECDDFYQSIVDLVKGFYTTKLQQVLDNKVPARVGFRT